ncbi:TonB-dependent siderophore receptor [Acetobacter sp. TBRC 12305]|uniref:TonB-dependent siderophore receptor n=1 Tax=Acetobacter garciniae TaxID=2817435 RepID=A0A939HNV7_9PROT|nr:TonB-dependent siderophore receptor [Acetobacter garciniae]MBO1324469.1 TonB-dependent siderophore receptor [Acetobacter garciniae]MBX0344158.1 TonB-dependent siderophore receptor [Acetobacter garciniae]
MTSTCLVEMGGRSAAAQTASATRHFSIPAQPLRNALRDYFQQSGVQVAYPTMIASDARSTAISGDMTPQEALSRLLSGTGLIYRSTGPNSVSLLKASSGITLGPVRVQGAVAHESPTGPGVGYVAENTMSGTKTDTPITEIPNSIYVVTKQQMQDQQVQNLAEALRYTPGIYAEGMGQQTNGAAAGFGGGTFIQRGFSSSQFIDGLISNSEVALDPSFIERVETINGPTSVMYGQAAPGGIINESLKRPTEAPLRNVTVGFGNWNRYEATFDVSDKITSSGNLKYRIAGIGVSQDTQTDYVRYHRVGVSPSFDWKIDDKTDLTLIGNYVYTPEDGAYSSYLPAVGTLFPGKYGRLSRHLFMGEPGWNNHKESGALFEYLFSHRFNSHLTFQQTFRYEESKTNFSYVYTKYGALDADGVTQPRVAFAVPNTTRTAALDSHLVGNYRTGEVRHTAIVGVDFWDYHSNGQYYRSDANSLNIYAPQYGNFTPHFGYPGMGSADATSWSWFGRDTYDQVGVYFQDQIRYKGLTVTLGGREDWFSQYSWSKSSFPYTGTSSTTTSPFSTKAFTWRAGATYELDFGLAPYFSYATSFQPQTGTDVEGHAFKPTQGKQFEAGLKYKPHGFDALFTASAFHIDQTNVLTSDPQNPGYSIQTGQMTSKGFEVSAQANVTRDLRILASYTYDDVRYSKSNDTTVPYYYDPTSVQDGYHMREGAAVPLKGKYADAVPRNMTSLFVNYALPKGKLRGLEFNFGTRYVGWTYANTANSFKVPAFILFDTGMRYDFGKAASFLKGLVGQLTISNLTNRYYVTSCGTAQCYIGQGRRVYGNLSYSW